MIDTHCHLYAENFKDDISQMLEKARKTGVKQFFFPAIDKETYQDMINLEQQFPGECYAMMGLHPCSVKDDFKQQLQIARSWLEKRKFIAIGETGLDFYWDKTFATQQYDALHTQIQWALEYNLPIVLHTRNAMQETIDVIKSYTGNGLKGVFHCFGGTPGEAGQIAETGFLMGIGGVVTYKNNSLDIVLKQMDLKHFVLETDAPYLSPVPYRGKRNESSYLPLIAKKISEIKQVTVEEIGRVTDENANNLFKINR